MSTARDVAILCISTKLNLRIREYFGKCVFFLERTKKCKIKDVLAIEDFDFILFLNHKLADNLKIGKKIIISSKLTLVYNHYSIIFKVENKTLAITLKEYEKMTSLAPVVKVLCPEKN